MSDVISISAKTDIQRNPSPAQCHDLAATMEATKVGALRASGSSYECFSLKISRNIDSESASLPEDGGRFPGVLNRVCSVNTVLLLGTLIIYSVWLFELCSWQGKLNGGQAVTNAVLTNAVMVFGVFAVTFAASGWLARWLLPVRQSPENKR